MKANVYLDSSVVMDAIQGDSNVIRQMSGRRLFSSALLEVEITRTLERSRVLSQDQLGDFGDKIGDWFKIRKRIALLDIGGLVLQRACLPFLLPVRSLDSIHIASAEWIRDTSGEEILFFTRDRQQARAAESRGLTLVEPAS